MTRDEVTAKNAAAFFWAVLAVFVGVFYYEQGDFIWSALFFLMAAAEFHRIKILPPEPTKPKRKRRKKK